MIPPRKQRLKPILLPVGDWQIIEAALLAQIVDNASRLNDEEIKDSAQLTFGLKHNNRVLINFIAQLPKGSQS